jgi:glucokinase
MPKPNDPIKSVIALDIGGTKISAALSDFEGNILQKKKIDTQAKNGAVTVLNNLLQVISDVLDDSKIHPSCVAGIGISTFGQVDHTEGIIKYATETVPGWTGIHLKEIVERRFGIKTVIDNDAFCAAWGERVYGIAKTCRDLVVITLGTGIGGAIFTQGRLLEGVNGLAGLIGHTCIEPSGHDCNCGASGCIESYASGWGLVKVFKDLMTKEYGSYPPQYPEDPDARYVFSMQQESEAARAAVNQMIWRLGATIGSLVTLLNPELVVVGGGLSNIWEVIYPKLLESVKRHSTPPAFKACSLEHSTFPDDMGLMGAIALVSTGPIPRLSDLSGGDTHR